ncbi:hypothetical protein Tco_0011764 [Tanacetum coccineum]
MRQHRWIELLSDYDCEIQCHPGKVNVVADALCRKERMKPLRVQALVMTIDSNLPSQILNEQVEAVKEESLHSLITKATTLALRQHPSRHFTVESVNHLFAGLRMQAAHDRHKIYADKRRKPLEFQAGDKFMLKVSPWKGIIHFGKRGKLNLRYIRPFKILAKVGLIAYRLELPQELSGVYNTFHAANLDKCLSNKSLVIPLEKFKLMINFI